MIKVGILTSSDRTARGEREDISGQVIKEIVTKAGWNLQFYEVVPDDMETIMEKLVEMSDRLRLDLVLTTGGTGLGPRDVMPEATLRVIHREVPGIAEYMRQASMSKTPTAMLSRATAGIRARTLIVNLPGSPKAVRESLEAIMVALPHAIEVLKGEVHDCAEV